MSLHPFDLEEMLESVNKLTEKVDETSKLVDKVSEARKVNDKLFKEIIQLYKDHYLLLCYGILKMYWYTSVGDTANLNDIFHKLVQIAIEQIEKEKENE